MPPIVCVVGRSETGKTTLIERLIPELRRRGYRVSTIKHRASGFDLDQPGKDSWRHAQAGSERVILSSPQKLALIENVDHDLTLAELTQFMKEDSDIVLVEGFKEGKALKIEVHREGLGELVCPQQELMAVVTDERLDLEDGIPQYSPDDISGLAGFIEKTALSQREGEEMAIFADGKPLPLGPFIKNLFSKVICDMVSSLKGIESPKSINISIRKHQL